MEAIFTPLSNIPQHFLSQGTAQGVKSMARRKSKLTEWAIVGIIAIVALSLLSIPFLTNPYVPAGHEAYIYKKPVVFGQGGYTSTLTGPAKHGVSWRKYAYIIDIRPTPYKEAFKIRMKDNLNVSIDVYVKASPIKGQVKGLIDEIGKDWYSRFVKPEARSICRKAIAQYSSEEVPRMRGKIALEIKNGFKEGNIQIPGLDSIVKGRFIKIHSVVVSNIDYPAEVDEAINRKMAARQELEKKATQLEIAKRDAEIQVAEAKGIAKSQEIINSTLTAEYLQHEAIMAAKSLAKSPNTTFYFVPTSTTGMGMPLVLSPKK